VIDIRPLTDADIDAAAAVHVRSWRAGYAGILPDGYLAALDPARFATRTRDMPAREGLIAVRDAAIIGLAGFGPYREENGELDHAHGELYSLYVAPEAWGTGAGRALFASVAEQMTGVYPDLRLWVLEDNLRARRFYERAGLSPDGLREMWTPRGTTVTVPELRYSMAL
jgi:ribosomal protein S18 acetylase RimI-like enzyme